MTKKTYIDGLGREIIERELARGEETDRDKCEIHATISAMMQLQHSKNIHQDRQDRGDTLGEYQDVYSISPLTKTLLGIAFSSLAFAIIGRYLLIVFDVTRPGWAWAVGVIVGMMALVLQAGLNMFD